MDVALFVKNHNVGIMTTVRQLAAGASFQYAKVRWKGKVASVRHRPRLAFNNYNPPKLRLEN